MLINVSYAEKYLYIWGLTNDISQKQSVNFIEVEESILYKIALKCALKPKYVSPLKTISVSLPTKDNTVDVTGESTTFQQYSTYAYCIPLHGFMPYAPTRIKKEFPKKNFMNVHFSNSFTLTHLLARITSQLFDARSYYAHLSNQDGKLHTKWCANLQDSVRFYIEKLTQSMPESFFILNNDRSVSHFMFIRQLLDDAMHSIMAHTQMLDPKLLKNLDPTTKDILNNILASNPQPLTVADSAIAEKVMPEIETVYQDNAYYTPIIKFELDQSNTNLFKCYINLFDNTQGTECRLDSLYAKEKQPFYDIFHATLNIERIAKILDITEPIHIAQMSSVLEKVKNIQALTGCKVSLPTGMTHVPVAPRAEVFIEAEQFEDNESLFSPAAISNIKWNILLGDTPVTLEELQKLADENQTHYMSGDTLIPVNVDQLHSFLKHVKKIQKNKLTPFDLLRADAAYGINYNVSSGWLKKVFQQLRGQTPIKEQTPPKDLNATLRPYQVRGYSWLCFMRQAGLGACLADDMGLGKTIQTIAYMLRVRQEETQSKKPFLLVCPTSLLSNWQRELSIFAPQLIYHVHHGADRDKEADFFDADIVITSYSLADRDLSFLKQQLWDAIILDEAQNVKNANAKQTKAVKSLNARHRIILTGTPIENRPTDIWSLMDFVNHGLLGNKTWFNSQYGRALSYSSKKEQQENAQKVAQQLKLVVSPFMLRRLKTDTSIISDLPDRINHKIICKLSLEQTSLYKACVDNMLSELSQTKDGLARRGLILTTLMRLKQICNHPAQFTKNGIEGASGKIDVLYDLLNEILANDEKVLIFTQFKSMGTILTKLIYEKTGKHVPFLNGSTPAKDRGKMVQDFQVENSSNIFILSLKAGGIGLNLTAANHVIHYDRWWNPAVEDQATSRAHRIGQEKIVSVHTFICNGTIEDRIDSMIEQKISLAQSVVGEGEGWITELTDSELKDLLTLKDAA